MGSNLFVRRSMRGVFYGLTGLLLILITTPSLVTALTGSSAAKSVALWPLAGLLAYFLHLFEHTGESNPALGSTRATSHEPF